MIGSIFLIFLFILWCSVCEWTLHKFLMHKPHKFFMYPYSTHTLTHHVVFKGDDSYDDSYDKEHHVPMSWWNGVIITVLSASVFLVFSIKLFFIAYMVSLWYYCLYEYIHWCMHLPKNRFIEKSAVFKWLNNHHLLHHKYMNRNYNVVVPFADFIFGTLMTKEKAKFSKKV